MAKNPNAASLGSLGGKALRLKYHNSIADAVADLGRPEEISKIFVGFQKFLYQEARPV
jgi:hypothetical protein